ncbi:hypothetical protein FS837_012875 [Tulasnella sp. UAMH 9824]|nr:hypothetical protein FS837_012875 [Tulasnella sp. UAMH 9824]
MPEEAAGLVIGCHATVGRRFFRTVGFREVLLPIQSPPSRAPKTTYQVLPSPVIATTSHQMQRDTRPFRVGYAESSFGRCSVCTKDSNVMRTGDLQVVKVLGSDVKIRHWECLSKTMSQDIARLYPSGSEIRGYNRLNQWDQEKIDELITKFRRPTGEVDGVNSWVRETSNAVQVPLDSDRASTDFGEPSNERPGSWPSQPQQPSNASRSSVAPALGLELHSTTATTTAKASATANAPTRQSTTATPADLPLFKANVEIAAAKIEVAKAQVKQELAKRKLLDRQIALRGIRRRLRAENDPVQETASGEAKEAEVTVEDELDSKYVDAEIQTEEAVKEKPKAPEEPDEEDDELQLADSDICIAKAEIRVAEAEGTKAVKVYLVTSFTTMPYKVGYAPRGGSQCSGVLGSRAEYNEQCMLICVGDSLHEQVG